jgi:hypothetical protein
MNDLEEKIISVSTGLALGDDYFAQQEYMGSHDFIPVVHSLINECKDRINKPGIYEFKLTVSKLK